jgi:hypothetical protein
MGIQNPDRRQYCCSLERGPNCKRNSGGLIEHGRASFSSFDHQQKYGLPVVIDAIQELRERLADKVVEEAVLDEETGDLLFRFTHDTKLQILNVTGYEIWDIRFPDGTGEYSNYAK